MESDSATSQHEMIAPVRSEEAETLLEADLESRPDEGFDWNTQPEQMTTREVATLFGKSPGNIRARASRGDFGNTVTGEDGLPRYDRARVRAVYERITAREAQTRAVTNLYASVPGAQISPLGSSLSGVITGMQAQHQEQIALWAARLSDAQQIALQAQQIAQAAQREAQELRDLMAAREETTRETLSHMDSVYSETIAHLKESLAKYEAQKAEALAPKSETAAPPIAALPATASPPSFWRRLFGG